MVSWEGIPFFNAKNWPSQSFLASPKLAMDVNPSAPVGSKVKEHPPNRVRSTWFIPDIEAVAQTGAFFYSWPAPWMSRKDSEQRKRMTASPPSEATMRLTAGRLSRVM